MRFASRCAVCGEALLPADRFCIQCGEPAGTAPGPAPRSQRIPLTPQPVSKNEVLHRLARITAGDYDIAGELGRGGMAVVYLAHDLPADRKVAIKVLAPALENDPDSVTRFLLDAQTAARLEHPHIIPIYRVEKQRRPVYFVMKFIDGGALDTILQRAGPLPISVTQTILGQLGSALDYAHRRGVVHRDVKPANVLLDREGWVVMSDFGIAKVAQQLGLTMTGSFVGTPTYMSPEQCAAKQELTGASDQYALGVMGYEMLAGRPPFVADSAFGLLLAHAKESPAPLMELRPDCPSDLAVAIMRMLEKEPERRWPSMKDAVSAIGGRSREPLGGDAESDRILQLVQEAGSRNTLAQLNAPASPVPLGRTSSSGRPANPSHPHNPGR